MTIADVVTHPWVRLIALLIMAPLFFVGGPDWANGPLYKSAWNLGHILFFGLLMLALRPDRWLRGWRLWLTVTVIVFAAGWIIESIQGDVGREADWEDMFRNLIGTWLAIAWLSSARAVGTSFGRAALWTSRLIVTALLAAQLSAVASVAAAQIHLARQLPAVYDFDNSAAINYWSGSIKPVVEHHSQGDHALEIQLTTTYYSGVTLHNLPWNWRGYEMLTITFFNPGDKLALTLRINDERHDRTGAHYNDRFNTRLNLNPGVNEFNLPLSAIAQAPESRDMAMGEIRRMGLFATGLEKPRRIYLTELKLR